MRKFSFTLAILLIAATIIGTVNAVSVADYIAEGNAHFAAGELAQAWDAFKMAENLAVYDNNFNEQVDVINARLACGTATQDPYYREIFGGEAYNLFEKLMQENIDPSGNVRDIESANALAGNPGSLTPVIVPPGDFGFSQSIAASQQEAQDAVGAGGPSAVGGTGSSWWYCPCGDGVGFNDWAAFNAHWDANHPYGCRTGSGAGMTVPGYTGGSGAGGPVLGYTEGSEWVSVPEDEDGDEEANGNELVPEDEGTYKCYCCPEEFSNLDDLLNHEYEWECYDPRYM